MKLSILSFLVPLLGAIVPVAQANFDIYHHFIGNPFGTSYDAWKIFATDPTCAQTDSTPTWFDENDVSKRMLGVVCEGTCGGLQRADGITRLEIHFSNNPLYHWTIYKGRGYRMYGLDGNVYGECFPFPGVTYNCGPGGLREGRRKFRCITRFTAAQIYAGRA